MLANTSIQTSILQLITVEQAWFYGVIPFEKKEGTLWLYTSNNTEETQEELEMMLGSSLMNKMLDDGKLV